MNEAARRGAEPTSRLPGSDSIFRTADVVGDAWSWLVMRESILFRISRFEDFRARLGIARSTLSARLAQLTAGGLLRRHEPGFDYWPTESGMDFFGCLMVSMRWGDRWYFDPDSRPQPVVHLGCGLPLEALLQCGACHQELRSTDVTAHRPASSAGLPSRAAGQKRRSPSLALLERERVCSIARTLTVTGDWWTGLVIRECFFGTRRFDQFQRRLDIAPNILSGRLRRLVELGILTTVQYQAWPIRHEYRLTDKGTDFYHVPLSMLTWGQRWIPSGQPDTRLTHQPCGSSVSAVLACSRCSEAISREDVALA
jgi:DNA-binding HxlR family transcriptional regulator